ncbi:Hypothetical protein PBC10988_7320 [Planctomycetales bacterium 10988]|nr:Hypothetical protein PBC10988_7320 [Planctomycetales bacterium 10988]
MSNEGKKTSANIDPWFSALTELTNVGVLMLDSDGEIQFVSGFARKILQCSEENTLDECISPIRDAIVTLLNRIDTQCGGKASNCDSEDSSKDNSDEEHKDSEQNCEACEEEHETPDAPEELSIDTHFEMEDGFHDVRVQVQPIDVESCSGNMILVHDLRAERLMERDFRFSARFRNLIRLYQSMAHDLRSPIASILIYCQLLQDQIDRGQNLPKEVVQTEREYLEVIQDGARTLDRSLVLLLEELVDFDADRAEIFDLRDLVESIQRLSSPQAKRQHISMTSRLPGDPVQVRGSKTRVKLAILNLVNNALEAMPKGGHIEIELDSNETTAIIRISDTGVGIPEVLKDQIFERYFTTKTTGTGIGLHVTLDTIQELGGSLSFVSEEDVGTTFEVKIPVVS